MAVGWTARRLAAMVAAGLVCVGSLVAAAHAQTADDDPAALDAEGMRLYQAGKYAEAIEIAKRLLAIAEKALGPNHPSVGTSLSNLALLYQAQGRHGEAEPLYKRSLTIREKALGPDHPDVGQSLDNLAKLYWAQGRYAEGIPVAERAVAFARKRHDGEPLGTAAAMLLLADLYQAHGRYAEAEPLYKRSLTICENEVGPDHDVVGTPLNNLANLYLDQGRYAEAEPLYSRSLAIWENALGPEHPRVGTALSNLAKLRWHQGRYAEAEPLYKRDLAITEKALGPDHPAVGRALKSLAALYKAQGRYTEAWPLSTRSLAILEKALGPDHPDVASSLENLAGLYRDQRRFVEAEPLVKRSLAIKEKALGPEHPHVGATLHNLAEIYRDQRRYAEAEALYKRSLAIDAKTLGTDHPALATSLNGLAALYEAQARTAEAEPLYRRSLAIAEKVLGPDHPGIGTPLNNLAVLYQVQGRYGEADLLYRRSLAIVEKALGPDHPAAGTLLSNLAVLSNVQSDWAGAVGYWRRSTGILRRRAERGLAWGGGVEWMALVKASHRLATQSPTATLAAEMFETAQWAQASEAAAAFAQMAARLSRGSPQLAGLVRELQNLVSEWQDKDKLLIAAKSAEPAKRRPDAERALAERLAAMDTRLAELVERLVQDFPNYAGLARDAPVSVEEVQAQLGADEALVLFLDTPEGGPLPEETFIWVVTKTDARWVRSVLGTAVLTSEVTALRCGLDAAAWAVQGAEKCATALGVPAVTGAPSPLPFDHARAHKLYAALFGQVQDLIKGKHLLIVPSGPLTQLPFQVLVTKAPAEGVRPGGSDPRAQPSVVGGNDGKGKGRAMGSDPQGLTPTSGDHRAAAWLAREHAITVLPAVSSLKALRRVARPSAAPRPMIGVGNPLLDGPDARYADRARLARARQRCPETLGHWKVTVAGPRRASVARVETRGGLADLAHLKAQVPLPETADELCDVAQDAKADLARDIRLGAGATEREIRRLSASGELAKYRMVHFTTHGTLAGEAQGHA